MNGKFTIENLCNEVGFFLNIRKKLNIRNELVMGDSIGKNCHLKNKIG